MHFANEREAATQIVRGSLFLALGAALLYTGSLKSEVSNQLSIGNVITFPLGGNEVLNNGLSGIRLSKTASASENAGRVPIDRPVYLTRRALSGKSGKGGKGSKKSKKGDPDRNERSCDGLRSLVFDLNTRIGDMGAETIRFNALADELERTAMYASNGRVGNMPSARKLIELTGIDEDFGYLESGVQSLASHRDNLKHGNERVFQLNTVLRTSADMWFDENNGLSIQNSELSTEVEQLRKENERLEAEKDRLAIQVGNLQDQVNSFSELVDDHESLNEQLNQSTAELELQIERLQASNEDYQRINEELSVEIDRLDSQNMEMREENENLARLNDQLNTTSIELDIQVQDLSDEVDKLNSENLRLETSVSELQEQVESVREVNFDLEENVNALSMENDRLRNQTDQLKKTNSELETILSFLEETGEKLGDSVGTISEYLAGQITAYRSIAAETLHNTYIQRVGLWDCAFREQFGDEDFVIDSTREIPADKFPEVLGYVGARVLDELCLSLTDFKDFLEITFQAPPIFTTNHIVSGINSYSAKAFDYYFPDTVGTGGLSEDEWALASYDCQNLPGNRRFEIEKTPSN